jgi:hypothetical protein
MRARVLAVAVLLLVAGCSTNGGGPATNTSSAPSATPHSSSASPTTSATSSPPSKPPPTAPPPANAPINDVIAWIQAGAAANPADFHSATRDGDVTQLPHGDVAFTGPSTSDVVRCMTDSTAGNGDLACLIKLANPPPRPADAYGHWEPGWIEFDGATLTVGGVHGDPGRFVNGDGPPLPYGKALKFGDYQCRSDPTGVYCVNYAHLSAVRIGNGEVQPLGCLQSAPSPPDVGMKFSC